jgi:hypothetical protein
MSSIATAKPKSQIRSPFLNKISAPFLRDTATILEKFMESVSDLYTHVYTEQELYQEIQRMSEEQLFASLSEYLEDIKGAIFESLTKNLESLSVKFLHICDRKEAFDKYTKVLKDKWRNSSSHRVISSHDDRMMKSAKDYVNKLSTDAKFSDSALKTRLERSGPLPMIHSSQFAEINERSPSRKRTREADQSLSHLPEHLRSTSRSRTPSRIRQSLNLSPSVKRSPSKTMFASTVQKVEELKSFTHEVLDPQLESTFI